MAIEEGKAEIEWRGIIKASLWQIIFCLVTSL